MCQVIVILLSCIGWSESLFSYGLVCQSPCDLIVQSCSSVGLDFSKCRGLGFDGASNMAGKTNGEAAVI